MALMRCDTYDDEQHMMMHCPRDCNPSLLREGGGWKGGGVDRHLLARTFLPPPPPRLGLESVRAGTVFCRW